ncbi:MAG: HIT domain-containing protein [Planctomycetes bacterium]|nr:HIT domain-containing protein [Planctomycetota bacterium]
MEWPNIWAPWRINYIKGLGSAEPDISDAPRCFLCEAQTATDRDAELLVLHRAEAGFIILNRYPYTNGHLLVAPNAHIADLPDLSAADRHALMDLTVLAERVIATTFNPQGVNIGVNIGRCAGAGLPGHLHVHLVPRWGGDTNFMNVIAGVRVSPQALEESYEEMKAVLPKVLDLV